MAEQQKKEAVDKEDLLKTERQAIKEFVSTYNL